MHVIHVALPIPLHRNFSYLHVSKLATGLRVAVPFGKTSHIGIVVDAIAMSDNTDSSSAIPTEDLKAIDEVLDETPPLTESLFSLAKWLSDYYHHPLGETLFTILPVWLRQHRSQADLERLICEPCYSIADEGKAALPTLPASATLQQQLLQILSTGPQCKSALPSNIASSVVKKLIDKGWITSETALPVAGTPWLKTLILGNKPIANREQGAAIGTLISQLGTFSVSLLEGITGSGKTEVYLQLMEAVLLQGQQVLVLVPEIGLTSQTVARFEQRFGQTVGILHSQVSAQKRATIFLQARLGLLAVIIGTRSAIFTPFYDLGLIVVDEEHDDSYKQQDGLRYHARDVAAVRAQRHNIPLLLGSATPSLETLNNALSGRYLHMHLKARAGGASPVKQYVQDLRHHPLQGGIAHHLIEKMRQHLSAGNQVLVFLNRRGFAPAMICHDCGHVEMCQSCDKPMTWHKQAGRLQCHHCGAKRRVPSTCRECGSTALTGEGVGTEQLQETLTSIFPNVPIARIDRDITRRQKQLEQTFEGIKRGEYKILVGTQIIAKGHHFPDVTLVVVIDADAALFSADVRSTEKLGQLVTQIAGRAGRAEKLGEMWLQTYHPQHPVLQELFNNGYGSLARNLLAERKQSHAIPFCTQAIVRAESQYQDRAFSFLQAVKTQLLEENPIHFIGPLPALVEKKQGRYRMLLLLQSSSRRDLHLAVHRLLNDDNLPKLAKQVRWAVDIDAIDIN